MHHQIVIFCLMVIFFTTAVAMAGDFMRAARFFVPEAFNAMLSDSLSRSGERHRLTLLLQYLFIAHADKIMYTRFVNCCIHCRKRTIMTPEPE